MSAPDRSGHNSDPVGNRVYYIYGLVPGDVELTADARGIGDPPGKVELVRHQGIAALVTEIDATRPLGRPEDLMAHQRLLDAASAETPVLPLRFGAVLTGLPAVSDDFLAPHDDEFAAALEELEGRAEYVVKGRYVEQAVLTEVLSENREAARLRDSIRAAGNQDATRDLRIRLGEMVTRRSPPNAKRTPARWAACSRPIASRAASASRRTSRKRPTLRCWWKRPGNRGWSKPSASLPVCGWAASIYACSARWRRMTSSPPRCRGGVIVEMLTVLFRWPLLPVRGLIGLAQLLRDQAEREFHDPAAVRRLLEEAAGARDSGELSDEEVSRLEHQAVSRLIRPSTGEVR